MVSRSRSMSLCGAALLWTACTTEPQVVASNCEMGDSCLKTAALKLDAVDILLVVDNSGSVADKAEQLKKELPHLLEAITTGESDGMSFPPAKSVHVAVATTDMGGAILPHLALTKARMVSFSNRVIAVSVATCRIQVTSRMQLRATHRSENLRAVCRWSSRVGRKRPAIAQVAATSSRSKRRSSRSGPKLTTR